MRLLPKHIGEHVNEQLHIPPATPSVWKHVRFKYAAVVASGAVRARRHATRPLPGSLADGMPLCRMEAGFARAAIDLALGEWMIGALDPSPAAVSGDSCGIAGKPHIHGDETTVQEQQGEWCRAEHLCRGDQHPKAFLADYTATLIAPEACLMAYFTWDAGLKRAALL